MTTASRRLTAAAVLAAAVLSAACARLAGPNGPADKVGGHVGAGLSSDRITGP